MKYIYLYLVLIVCSLPNIHAQYTCDFEECPSEQECLYSDPFGPSLCSNVQNHTPGGGNWSGLIPDDGSTDAILDLGNKIFGRWGLQFYMYIPTGKEGYFNIQGQVPIGAGEWVVGNFFFNKDVLDPGRGFIDWSDNDPANDTYFDFPHDQWFELVINVDISTGISLATWEFGVDGVVVVPAGTPFTDSAGSAVTSLGGIDFFSISTDNTYYLDDILFREFFYIIEANELVDKGFSLYPNPVKDELHLKAKETITKVCIYNLLGQEIYSKNINKLSDIIDTSNLINGTYIVQVTIGNAVGSLKIVK